MNFSPLGQPTTKVLIAGYYGSGNAGDEAILSCLLAELRARIPNLRPTVISAEPNTTSATYGVDSIAKTDKSAIIAAIQDCGLVVLGGGGLLQDYWDVDLSPIFSSTPAALSYYAYAALALVFDKPLVLYAIGVGPISTPAGRLYTRLTAEQARLITVRDEESGALLRSLGVAAGKIHVTADPAFLLNSQPAVLHLPRPVLGVALRNWNLGVDTGRWEAEVAGALNLFLEQHSGSVLFLPFQRSADAWDDDVAMASRLKTSLRQPERTSILDEAGQAERLAGAVGACDVVLAMRYHSALFAMRQGTPLVGLIYDPKIRQLFSAADCSEYALDLGQVRSASLADLLTQALGDSTLPPRLLSASTWLTQAASANASQVAALVTGSAMPPVSPETSRHWLDELSAASSGQPAGACPSLSLLRQAMAERRQQLQAEFAQPAPYDVICFPGIEWSFRWMRAQQLMSQFAERGHRVFFLSVTSFLPPGPAPFQARPLRDGVWEIHLAAPQALDVYSGVMTEELCAAIVEDLSALAREFSIQRAVSMLHLATWAQAAYRLRELHDWPVVYDCMDDWSGFAWMPDALLEQEVELARRSDLVIVTAQKLWDKWAPLNPRTVLARNAADFAHFQQPALGAPPDGLPAGHPIVGFFGAMDSWFDVELVRYAALERPDYQFVLIGAVYDAPMERLQGLPNVHLFGHQSYAALPNWLHRFDVCIIPFKINTVTQATDPVKFYEYIAAGKPVVATRMPELAPYRQVIYLAGNADEFVLLLDEASRETDPQLSEQRRALARENSWTARYELIDSALQRTPPVGQMPPRILFVYPTLSMGGLEVVLQCRVLELLRRRWQVRLIFLEEIDGRPLFESIGADVRICPDAGGFTAELNSFQPDWVVSIDTPQILDAVRNSDLATRLIYESHSTYPHILAPLVAPDFLKGISGLIVPSISQQQRIVSLLATEARIAVVPNALQPDFFHAADDLPTPARPVVLWVGRLDAHKNWRAFLEIACQLRGRIDAEFHLVSGGFSNDADRTTLQELIDSAGLADRFRWLPTIEHSQMPAVYRTVALSGGCLVSTSVAESFGLAVLEAMACHCPVVVPDIEGLRELVEPGDTGRLYPSGDIAAACSQIEEILHQTPGQRRAMTDQAFQTALRFASEAATDRFLEILSDWATQPDTAIATAADHLAARRAQLSRMLAERQPSSPVVVIPPSLPWSSTTLASRPRRWASTLASQGCLVFYCDPRHLAENSNAFPEVEPNVFVANVPLPVYDVVESPLVLADARNLTQLAAFRQPRVIYDCLDGASGTDSSSLHPEWLARAEVIVVPSVAIQSAVAAWRPDAMVVADEVESWQDLGRQALSAAAKPADPARLPALLAWREQQVQSLLARIEQRDRPAVEILHGAVTEQKRILAERDKSIAFLRGELANSGHILAERDRAIAFLQHELATYGSGTAGRSATAAATQKQLPHIESELASLSDELAVCRLQLRQQQEDIEFLKHELASREAIIASHSEGISFLRGEIANRESLLRASEAELVKLQQTTQSLEARLSWWQRWRWARSRQ